MDLESNEAKRMRMRVGDPDEKTVLLLQEQHSGRVFIWAITNRRNIYISPDWGDTFLYQRRLDILEYWGKRINAWWRKATRGQ